MKKIIKAMILALVIAAIGTAVWTLWRAEQAAGQDREPSPVSSDREPSPVSSEGVIS